jgi:putative ABC transport system permease protein
VRTTVVGLVQPRTGAAVSQGGVLFMPLPAAQRRFAAAGELDRIQLVLAEGATVGEVQAELAGRLPPGVKVLPPATRSPLAAETMMALDNGLRLATGFSLLAAVFIIMNTFLMSVGQRRRQLAVLRAIGATRQQVSGLLLREAVLMGVVGTVGGLLAGMAVTRVISGAMCNLFQTPARPVELAWLPLLLAIAFGLGISLLGAALPARQATRYSPQEGMSGVARDDSAGHWWQSVVAGVAVLAISTALFVLSVAGWIPIENAVVMTILGLLGLVLLLPLVLTPLTYLVDWLLRPVARVESRLARRQLLRHRGRTTLTIGVLFIAVSTGLGLAGSVLDNVQDVRNWYRTAIVGDFFVRAAMPDMETGLSASVPEETGQRLREIDGVNRIGSVRWVAATAGGQDVVVVAVRNEYRSPSDQATGRPIPELPADGAEIGSVLAQRTGLKVGDSVLLDTKQGPRPLRITAVVNDYFAGGLTVHLRRETAERLLGMQGVDAFVVTADHQKLKEVELALRQACVADGTLLQSYADLTQTIEGMMAGVVASLWGLLVLGLVVAAFGVANTLGMNVLEQTRELGLLRVVAMTRGQVRKTILLQAVMLGVLGVVPGLLASLAMAYVMYLATQPVIGHPVPFSWHPWMMAGGLAAALLIVLAAAGVPAERAARLKLQSALRYE